MFSTINGTLVTGEGGVHIQSDQGNIVLQAKRCKLFLLCVEAKRRYVIPFNQTAREQHGRDILWILPEDEGGAEPALLLRHAGARISLKKRVWSVSIEIESSRCEVSYFENRPQCDFFARRYAFCIGGGEQIAKSLAAFYWDSMLPMAVEKTVAADFPYSDGYVLSTLQKGTYPGTYPDVDHEFQVKGRIAMSDELDLDIVKRMIELQLNVMRRDPEGKWRDPCSIQPKGNCEYHVSRNSLNRKNRAIMFLLTGNIEIIESVWLYAAKTKDFAWLESIINDLEHVAGFVVEQIDGDGRLWSDVYYEDQVIKDGRETIAQAFAANSFSLLSGLEYRLGRAAESRKYAELSQALAKTLVSPLPLGYWDEANRRFVDWVDRKGNVHDHMHLLANELPVLFGYAPDAQRKAVEELLACHADVFQKFPSFVAAKIEDYTKDEIGSGGPYDLSAAGRYWCWDAGYHSGMNHGEMLLNQLEKVAGQAAKDRFIMGERYDMNHVYYVSKKMWHGAGHYYEYPNVFAWVLINLYLGIKPDLDADVFLQPKLAGYGSVAFHAVGYSYQENEFSVINLSDKKLSVKLDLSALFPQTSLIHAGGNGACRNGDTLSLDPGETVVMSVEAIRG